MDSLAHESKKKHGSPFILNSLDPTINNLSHNIQMNGVKQPPKVSTQIACAADQLDSLRLEADVPENNGRKSIPLIDATETLRLKSENEFLKALKLESGKKVKVVSIFGNTGEGKSFTLNKLFFNGEEVFQTSPSQTPCTLGVWAKYDPTLNVICLDTEGLLGITKKESQRTRLLLKILAVSDIIIYRTTAERLHRDLYAFLGGASNVYKEHFFAVLQKTLTRSDGEKSNVGLGPGVIIFHETKHTNTLDDLHDQASVTQSAEDILRQNFANFNLNCDAFAFIKYIGVKTRPNTPTSFERLKAEIHKQLETSDVRSPRDAKYIYLMLKSLNEKFQDVISDINHQQYFAQFFTCQEKCQSCKEGCRLSMGHKDEGDPHKSDVPCKFQHQYQNSVYLCKHCYKNGHRQIVTSSYQTANDTSWGSLFTFIWSGYVIECPKCGEIYRSRKHWYGNQNPEESVVRVEVVHVWPGEPVLFGTYHPAQKVMDGATALIDAVTSVASQPTRTVKDYVNDKIAPSYWTPNHEIRACFNCNVSFTPSAQNEIVPSKHHCRGCGRGFCETCSSKRCPVPPKGWSDPVRVCDACYEELEGRGQSIVAEQSVEAVRETKLRYYTETIVGCISAAKPVLDIPKEICKDYVRPSYWTPNDECIQCVVCEKPFGPLLPLHHCRECGKGVCDSCSKFKKAVPSMGWHSPVRVCDLCRQG